MGVPCFAGSNVGRGRASWKRFARPIGWCRRTFVVEGVADDVDGGRDVVCMAEMEIDIFWVKMG